MAGLDTSIALGIKPVDFGDPNEGRMNALRAQIMQMQMQQGQFNMMKAQRDMEYQNQQRAAAAAAAARDKAAEAQALKLYGQTGAPGYQAYSPSMEPGAASDVGMLGGGQGYTEGAVNRLTMDAKPKNFDDAIANALAKGDAASILAARKLMALKETENVYKKSNLGVDEAAAKTKKAGYEASDAEIGNFDKNYDVFRKQAMTIASPQEAAAWTSAMYDNPVLGKMMNQMGMTKEQAVAKAAQEYAADPQKWVASHMNLSAKDAYDAVYAVKDKDKKLSDVGTLIRERAALDKNAPDYQELLEIYNDRIAKANNIKGESGDGERKAQSDIGKLYADLEALKKDDPEYGPKRAGIIRAIQEKTGGKAKDVGTADATIANAEQSIKDIDDVLSHPELKNRAGSTGPSWAAGKIAGTATYGLESQVNQIKGEAFLNAFNMLRGGGAITDAEGKKATAAINRMDLNLSFKDFKKAADDAKEILQNGMKRAQDMKARGTWGGETSAPAGGPSVDDLLKKYGG